MKNVFHKLQNAKQNEKVMIANLHERIEDYEDTLEMILMGNAQSNVFDKKTGFHFCNSDTTHNSYNPFLSPPRSST